MSRSVSMLLYSVATLNAGNSLAPSSAELQSPGAVCSVSQASPLEFSVYWDKYVRSYFVRFYNNTDRYCKVYYEIWNGEKWIDGAGYVEPHKSSSWSAGKYGKIRNIDPDWQ